MVDLGMTYPNGKVALADVNVAIGPGDFVFLVGPSGAGKSTFIRLLIREQIPTAGTISAEEPDNSKYYDRSEIIGPQQGGAPSLSAPLSGPGLP